MTLGKSRNLSEPCFPHDKTEGSMTLQRTVGKKVHPSSIPQSLLSTY